MNRFLAMICLPALLSASALAMQAPPATPPATDAPVVNPKKKAPDARGPEEVGARGMDRQERIKAQVSETSAPIASGGNDGVGTPTGGGGGLGLGGGGGLGLGGGGLGLGGDGGSGGER